MDLKQYQEAALTTAKPTALDLDYYLAPGLFSEAGELIQVFGKAHRDGLQHAEYQMKAAKEYGDCYWMAAVGLHVHGIHDVTEGEGLTWLKPETSLVDLGGLVNEILQDPDHPGSWVSVWQFLDDNCQHITGKTPAEVKAINLEKLADRQYRNAVEGDGDDR